MCVITFFWWKGENMLISSEAILQEKSLGLIEGILRLVISRIVWYRDPKWCLRSISIRLLGEPLIVLVCSMCEDGAVLDTR